MSDDFASEVARQRPLAAKEWKCDQHSTPMGIWTANMLLRKIKVASKMFLAVYL